MPIATLEPVQRLIAEEMSSVDQVIRRRLHSDVALIRQVSEHIISGGGKRLRPAVVLLAAGACGYSGSAHYQLAAETLSNKGLRDLPARRRGRLAARVRLPLT